MPAFLRPLVFTALMASTAATWAARDFTPQAGTWVVSSELNGQPGRGLAIDVQGNTFFMQVFGYEKNGDATFYTATGQLDGNSVTAPLMRYRDGRSFGSEARDGVEDSSPGNVTVSFSNGLRGTVQFPGEAAVTIQRFAIHDLTPSVSNPLAQIGQRGLHLIALNEDLQFAQYHSVMLSRNSSGTTEVAFGDGSGKTLQTLSCDIDPMTAQIQCPNPSSAAGEVKSLRLQITGGQVAGSITMAAEPDHALALIGQSQTGLYSGEPTNGVVPIFQQNYWEVSAPGPEITGYKREYFHQLMPINGTWIVADEATGKPGRGLALDVQNTTMVLQVFNYQANGQPTFHMGSGTYASAGANGLASRAQLDLNQYAGGRSLGGPAQSAQ